MLIDWLRSLRPTDLRRRMDLRLVTPTPLEPRTFLSAIPIGSEFRVNTYTTGSQGLASTGNLNIGMNTNGDFVIAWLSDGQDGSSEGVYAQRFNSVGVPQGNEFRVNSYTTDSQRAPSVAINDSGDFVITWRSFGQDGSAEGIYAQRFNSTGTPQGSEFQVNSYATDAQFNPAIAIDDDGDFVIAWQSFGQDGSGFGIYAQRFDSIGIPEGGEFQVNTFTTSDQRIPAIGMNRDGEFVITWQSFDQDGSSGGIYAQRFDSLGIKNGGEFRVNSTTIGHQSFTTIGMNAAGDFVITWDSDGQDGNAEGIYAQRYNSAAIAQGGEFQVNTYTTGKQRYPAISVDSDGDFVISWHSEGQDGSSYGIYAQRYDSEGASQGEEFHVNSHTGDSQSGPAIGIDSDGDFVVTWTSAEQDGSGLGIYAQRFRASHSDDLGVWRSGKFYLDSNHSDGWNGPVDDTLNSFGATTDIPLVGDWNGDGYDDIGVWRLGTFYLDANGNGVWDGPVVDWKFNFGNSSDTPVAGDWNNDGKDEIGVWRAAKFYLDLNGNQKWDGAAVDKVFTFGAATDKPTIGDWNGDGTDDVGVRRNQYFYLDSNGNRAWNSGVDEYFAFGNASDTPIVGDWDGDGIDDIGVWRAGKFYLDATRDHMWDSFFDKVISFGATTNTPLIGYWRPKSIPGIPPAPAFLPVTPSLTETSEITAPPISGIDVESLASLLAPTKKQEP